MIARLLRSALDTEHHSAEARDIARRMLFDLPGGRRAYVEAVLALASPEEARELMRYLERGGLAHLVRRVSAAYAERVQQNAPAALPTPTGASKGERRPSDGEP